MSGHFGRTAGVGSASSILVGSPEWQNKPRNEIKGKVFPVLN
jgi:hypothetical protein